MSETIQSPEVGAALFDKQRLIGVLVNAQSNEEVAAVFEELSVAGDRLGIMTEFTESHAGRRATSYQFMQGDKKTALLIVTRDIRTRSHVLPKGIIDQRPVPFTVGKKRSSDEPIQVHSVVDFVAAQSLVKKNGWDMEKFAFASFNDQSRDEMPKLQQITAELINRL